MPAPPTYIDITTNPFIRVVTVAEFNGGTFGGVANECWFRYVVGADPRAFGWFNGLATGYSPATNLYADDGSTLINGNTGDNAMWWPLANNSTYYVRLRNNLGGGLTVNVNTLFESASIGNLGTIPDGSWIINDDGVSTGTTGFPSAVYGPDGAFIGFIGTLPAGEIGDSLPNKVSLWHDRFGMYGGQLSLFDANCLFVDDFTPSPALIGFPRISNDGTDFYVTDYQTSNVYRVDPTAITISGSLGVIPYVTDISGVGISRDGTTVFWAEGTANGVIRKSVLGSGVAQTVYTISTFAAGDYVALTGVNNHPGEVLVLIDDTIATTWFDVSAQVGHVLHLSADGVTQQDFAFDVATYGIIDHIHYSPNGAGEIYVWFFTDAGADQGRFGSVLFTTGAFSQLFEADLTSIGENLVGASDQIFGPSASCSMTTIGYPAEEPEPEAPEGEFGTLTELPIRWVLRTGVIT